jgi:hypothetical protein
MWRIYYLGLVYEVAISSIDHFIYLVALYKAHKLILLI